MNKIKLAREIARRTKPRFVEIPREKRVGRGTAMNGLLAGSPEVGARQAAAMARKAEEEVATCPRK